MKVQGHHTTQPSTETVGEGLDTRISTQEKSRQGVRPETDGRAVWLWGSSTWIKLLTQ